MIYVNPPCMSCKHYHRKGNGGGGILTCDAFPIDIPGEMFENDPRELPECANGIGYEPIEKPDARKEGRDGGI